MFNWLRRLVLRRPRVAEEANRLAKKSGQGEPPAGPGCTVTCLRPAKSEKPIDSHL
jgi:hypothetical protein